MREVKRCQGCGGQHVYGPVLDACRITEGQKCWTEYWCHDCGIRYARDLWDEEAQGPYPIPPFTKSGA